MKNKEWLKGLINEEGIAMDMNLLGRHDDQNWKNENIKINKGRLFYLIDQLDEPERPIELQELIEKYSKDSMSTYDVKVEREKFVNDLQNLLVPKQNKPVEAVKGYFKSVEKAKEVLEELGYVVSEKPKKVVVPKFVADYIEKWKYKGLTMYEWFSFDNNDVDEDVNKWLYNNLNEKNRRREYLLIEAIRNGYEVEKEKLYHVIDNNNETLLCKVEGEVMTVAKAWYIGYEQEFYHLTEKEIKDYDERYWGFAEEVRE